MSPPKSPEQLLGEASSWWTTEIVEIPHLAGADGGSR
jgi:hypothetical protein